MRMRILAGGLVSLLMCVVAQSSTWQVSYEGNALPEQEPPWYRMYSPPGDTRTIEQDPNNPGNHWLVIDSRADPMIDDWAECDRPINLQGPQERFWSEWRVSVVEQTGLHGDQGIDVKSDNGHSVTMTFGYDSLYCTDDYWTYPIAPGVFHTYRIESANLVTYRFWIDGTLVRTAPFFAGVPDPHASFGDIGAGGGMRSLVQWDFFRFGVMQIPEPSPVLSALIGISACGCRTRLRGVE
jgi:hypothetical protein